MVAGEGATLNGTPLDGTLPKATIELLSLEATKTVLVAENVGAHRHRRAPADNGARSLARCTPRRRPRRCRGVASSGASSISRRRSCSSATRPCRGAVRLDRRSTGCAAVDPRRRARHRRRRHARCLRAARICPGVSSSCRDAQVERQTGAFAAAWPRKPTAEAAEAQAVAGGRSSTASAVAPGATGAADPVQGDAEGACDPEQGQRRGPVPDQGDGSQGHAHTGHGDRRRHRPAWHGARDGPRTETGPPNPGPPKPITNWPFKGIARDYLIFPEDARLATQLGGLTSRTVKAEDWRQDLQERS